MFLVVEIDRQPVQRFSLQKLAEASDWPFVRPLSVKHPSLVSGIGAYTPFCYRKSLRLIYESDSDFPENLLDVNVNCTANELHCPIHIYSAVSSHQFPSGTSIALGYGKRMTATGLGVNDMTRVVELLKSPEVNGPDAGVPCLLNCFELCRRCQRVLYHRIHSPAVIMSIRMRVFITATGFLSHDWTNVFFTAYFDNTSLPQFDRVPLGSMFGATASLNDFAGAAFGKRPMHCDYADPSVNLVGKTITGYFHFPMPYWHEALIVVEGSDGLRAPVTVCFQITDVENFYEQSETGYLHGIKTYYRLFQYCSISRCIYSSDFNKYLVNIMSLYHLNATMIDCCLFSISNLIFFHIWHLFTILPASCIQCTTTFAIHLNRFYFKLMNKVILKFVIVEFTAYMGVMI